MFSDDLVSIEGEVKVEFVFILLIIYFPHLTRLIITMLECCVRLECILILFMCLAAHSICLLVHGLVERTLVSWEGVTM